MKILAIARTQPRTQLGVCYKSAQLDKTSRSIHLSVSLLRFDRDFG